MGRLSRVLLNIREAIGTLFDLLDFLSYLNIFTSIGSGGGVVIGWLYHIPTWVIVLLIVVCVSSTIFAVVRTVTRYRKWLKTKDDRIACLDIPVIIQKMHDRLSSLVNVYARSSIDNDQFQEALYQFGVDIFTNQSKLLKKLLTQKPKMKYIREFVNILASYFHEYDIGLKSIRDDDTKDIIGYQSLKVQLLELTKVMGDENIKDDISDILKLSYEACFAQLYQRQYLGIDNKPAQARLSVRYDAMNEALSKRIFKIQRKILRYWLWEA